MKRSFALLAALAALTTAPSASAALLPPLPPSGAPVQPYGTNDAGGFRNVLPPGENGRVNALDLARFQSAGTLPPHFGDQLGLYTGLLYASPHLRAQDLSTYYKDATFGVRPGQTESSENPRTGVTIVRDRAYGVPHVYGVTRADVEFGAGYAGAEDRLFLMDVLRHTGRSQLSSFVGGSRGNRAMDRTQWAIAPYTEADLQKQIDQAPRLYGATGQRLVADLNAYVDGINAYINRAKLDPTLLPAEYAALGKTPDVWKGTDVIATASLVGGIFGKGGGNELRSALLLQTLQKRYGRTGGRRAWSDFRLKNDPEAPTTILKKRYPYENTSPFSKRGLAIPDRGSVSFVDVGPPLAGAAKADATSLGARLHRSFAQHPLSSNWLLVSARESRSGHPIAVIGPQVGYYVPQILMEEDLHGPGFDARGTAFPGVNLVVQLGHGRDYAWSATTATSDNVDTFAEVLCQDDVHYLYKGKCLAMERLDRHNAWTPNVSDMTPPGSETLTALRTVHGIVYARGKVHGKRVAYVSSRTTYFHEADSAIGFEGLNDPSVVHDPQSFRKAIAGISFAFNWSYVDSKHIAYQLSGDYPQRARKTSPDFPVLGTGAYDWKGYNAADRTLDELPQRALPHTVDQKYLVSWNNKQAPGWAAADDKFTFGPIYRSQMLEARIKRGIAGKRKMELAQLVQAMEEPATQDIRPFALGRILRRAVGRPKDAASRRALALLRSWERASGHRRDLNKDGRDEYDDAITLMDAWWPKLLRAEFRGPLGPAGYARLLDMAVQGEPNTGQAPSSEPSFSDGWYGFVSKDLRGEFSPRSVRGRWSRGYCGRGSKARCRRILQASLRAALGVTRAQLYGFGDCAKNAQAACFDQDRSIVASGASIDPFPFQNRPTFQQIIELSRQVGR